MEELEHFYFTLLQLRSTNAQVVADCYSLFEPWPQKKKKVISESVGIKSKSELTESDYAEVIEADKILEKAKKTFNFFSNKNYKNETEKIEVESTIKSVSQHFQNSLSITATCQISTETSQSSLITCQSSTETCQSSTLHCQSLPISCHSSVAVISNQTSGTIPNDSVTSRLHSPASSEQNSTHVATQPTWDDKHSACQPYLSCNNNNNLKPLRKNPSSQKKNEAKPCHVSNSTTKTNYAQSSKTKSVFKPAHTTAPFKTESLKQKQLTRNFLKDNARLVKKMSADIKVNRGSSNLKENSHDKRQVQSSKVRKPPNILAENLVKRESDWVKITQDTENKLQTGESSCFPSTEESSKFQFNKEPIAGTNTDHCVTIEEPTTEKGFLLLRDGKTLTVPVKWKRLKLENYQISNKLREHIHCHSSTESEKVFFNRINQQLKRNPVGKLVFELKNSNEKVAYLLNVLKEVDVSLNEDSDATAVFRCRYLLNYVLRRNKEEKNYNSKLITSLRNIDKRSNRIVLEIPKRKSSKRVENQKLSYKNRRELKLYLLLQTLIASLRIKLYFQMLTNDLLNNVEDKKTSAEFCRLIYALGCYSGEKFPSLISE